MTEDTNVAALPIDPDAAWARYSALAIRAIADPKLLVDRDHCTACARAWLTFRDSFDTAGTRPNA